MSGKPGPRLEPHPDEDVIPLAYRVPERPGVQLDKASRRALVTSLVEDRNRLLEHAAELGYQLNPLEIDRSLLRLGFWITP
jgi:hypothetical protein